MGELYAEVIGDPVVHSKSPRIHRFWLDALGLEGAYRATHVPASELAAFMRNRRADPDWRGCNVTVPHKQSVLPFIDQLSPLAAEVGAVNTIGRDGTLIRGANTDVHGIVAPIPQDRLGTIDEACLIGSGGAALAALAAFKLLGVKRLGLNVRDPAKGERLLAKAGIPGRVGPVDDSANLTRAQLIVNATTLGMTGQDPMPESLLAAIASRRSADAIVFDMVYAPLETELLRAASARGLCVVDGLAMLIAQAALAFEIFFAVPPPRHRDPELRALLAA